MVCSVSTYSLFWEHLYQEGRAVGEQKVSSLYQLEERKDAANSQVRR